MKNCSCTVVGIVAGTMAVITGVVADMLTEKDENCCSTVQKMESCMRRKAGSAMHMLSNKIDKAADNITK